MRVNAVLPEDAVRRIDRIAKQEKKSRSSILREAAERIIEEYEVLKAEQLGKERLTDVIKTRNKQRKNTGKWREGNKKKIQGIGTRMNKLMIILTKIAVMGLIMTGMILMSRRYMM